LSKLFNELKRRNVNRVAVAYVIASWLILQVADVIIGNIEAPPWVFSVFLLALSLGFFPVVFFAWAYELTPEGLKKESEVDRDQSITSDTGKKLNTITIIMLVAVVAFVILERTMFSAPPEPAAIAEAPAERSLRKACRRNCSMSWRKSEALRSPDEPHLSHLRTKTQICARLARS
jgi:hypothetical protein